MLQFMYPVELPIGRKQRWVMVIRKTILAVIALIHIFSCGKSSVPISEQDPGILFVPVEGFKLTMNNADAGLSQSEAASGELTYSLSGCEQRASQLLTIPFSMSVAMPPVKLKSTSRLKDCSIQIDTISIGGVQFTAAQKALRSYVGSKSSVGLYVSTVDPTDSYAVVPSRKITFESGEKLAKVEFNLVKQENVGVRSVGELPPLLTLSGSDPLFFEGVDPATGHGLFRVRFVCSDVSATDAVQPEFSSSGQCEIPDVALQKIEDFEFLISKRTTDGEGLLPNDVEVKFEASAPRIKKANLPLQPGSQYFELSLLGEEVMSTTDKLWLLARYKNASTGAKSYAAWSIEAEKL